jgi:hypothetical protein
VSRFIKYGYVLLGRSPAVFLRVVPKRLHLITTQHFEQFGASVQKALFLAVRPLVNHRRYIVRPLRTHIFCQITRLLAKSIKPRIGFHVQTSFD